MADPRHPQLATPETMRALCEAVLAWVDSSGWFDGNNPLGDAVRAYRSETRVPLRTLAEVDAELGQLCRQYYAGPGGTQQSLLSIHERLKVVSREATAPEPASTDLCESGAYRWSRVPEALWSELGHQLAHADRYSGLRLELLAAIKAVLAAAREAAPETYGPRSVDDRGFPPGRDPATGATSSTDDLPDPDERECNCNQALGLKEQFARFVYYNFGGWLTNDVDRERWAEMRFLPEDVRARVEGYHEQRVTTGSIPDWCRR